jgi:2-dehydro-3-deoxyphosphogluconate aldolase/(4S)-4-hydroxy-2-oxoglutarate aldolase
VKEELPSALIGAGTVLEIAELDAACDAGAKFLVSPHFDPALLDRARERGVPYLPGALTPTEIVRAWKAGASCVKLFPGSAVGPGYVKAIRGPLPDVPLMPTGGVDEKNLGEWLKAGVVAVGMGGALATGTLDEIEVASRRIMGVLKTIRPAR